MAVPLLATPHVGADFMATDGRQPWDTLVLQDAPGLHWNATVAAHPDAWRADAERLGNGTASPSLVRVRVQPATATTANVTLAWTTRGEADGCRASQSGHMRWAVAAPTPGDVARPGVGVRVLTAGFLENGTLFYTNIEAVQNDSRWARSPIYSWDGGDALPVYVYDRERGERGAQWSATTAGTPVGPATGNRTAWDYFTTIRGFNKALKGLSTNTVRVVRLAPEDAYTDAAHAGHPLYGQPLVFLIKVVAVDPEPCPDTGCVEAMSRGAMPRPGSPILSTLKI